MTLEEPTKTKVKAWENKSPAEGGKKGVHAKATLKYNSNGFRLDGGGYLGGISNKGVFVQALNTNLTLHGELPNSKKLGGVNANANFTLGQVGYQAPTGNSFFDFRVIEAEAGVQLGQLELSKDRNKWGSTVYSGALGVNYFSLNGQVGADADNYTNRKAGFGSKGKLTVGAWFQDNDMDGNPAYCFRVGVQAGLGLTVERCSEDLTPEQQMKFDAQMAALEDSNSLMTDYGLVQDSMALESAYAMDFETLINAIVQNYVQEKKHGRTSVGDGCCSSRNCSCRVDDDSASDDSYGDGAQNSTDVGTFNENTGTGGF